MYPEQQTFGGKALRFGLSVPAFALGGAGRLGLVVGKGLKAAATTFGKNIPQFIGKNALGRSALRVGEFGASQAAIAPKEGEDYASQIRTAAGIGMATPAAGLLLKGTGKNLVKSGTFVA